MFSCDKYSQENLLQFCRRFLAVKKSAVGNIKTRGTNDLVLCSVVHASDESMGSVIYTINPNQKDPKVLWSDTLEDLPSVLCDKIFGTESAPETEDSERSKFHRTFCIKAFPTARLRIETQSLDTDTPSGKLMCFFPRLGWVQIVGAVGELDISGKPAGITFVGRNPFSATEPNVQVVSQFFDVSKTVLSSLSTYDKVQMFKQSKFL